MKNSLKNEKCPSLLIGLTVFNIYNVIGTVKERFILI